MKLLSCIPLVLFTTLLYAQSMADAWMKSQLGPITWQESYKGVLADYHPIRIILASDQDQVAGYLMHDGDSLQHRLMGDWSNTGQFQLQERDQYDRLTGYLTGSITNDQVIMKWKSADQRRLFDIKAFPERLIKIKNFKPAAEWIEVAGPPVVLLSVQKMDYGIVSGIAALDGKYSRFEGQCLDGTCSIWSTVIPDAEGRPLRIQMRQKDQTYYKVMLNDKEYKGEIKYTRPLQVRAFDNSSGFLDFVYPQLDSKSFDAWLGQRIDSVWNAGMTQLAVSASDPDHAGRLVYRSSGWIEAIDEGPSHISGMVTFINPDRIYREIFVWLKKEDDFIPQDELLNTPADLQRVSSMALAATDMHGDEALAIWLRETGYTMPLPAMAGVIMTTPFDVVNGDEFQLLPATESKSAIKKKYWRYFGW